MGEDSKQQDAGIQQQKPSIKEERIRKILMSYYSRSDVRKAMFEFSKNRECVPRYFEGFGTRPDAFQFDSDILELAKKGATSFHCSEELWRDPLELSTNMTPEEFGNLRTGWDLLIDIDCPYLEYSKKAANALIFALRKNGIKNIGIKFSGGKGFHIIIPWKAFPEMLSGSETKKMFPEWPRLICNYLKEQAREFLEKDLYASEDSNVLSKLKKGIRCERCKNMSESSELILYVCDGCRTKIENLSSSFERKRKIRCPNCQKEMNELEKIAFYRCRNCALDSRKNPENFNESFESIDVFEVLGLDVILVSPRHLFRMPYSLHEKTALASVVVNPEKISDFQITDADALKVKPVNFAPDSEPNEALQLLRNSLEFASRAKKEERSLPRSREIEVELRNGKENSIKSRTGEKKFTQLNLSNVSSDFYPPSIKKILEGMKTDGRKRALFILLNFFKSIGLSEDEIKTKIEEWDKKNAQPLREGYIRSQLSWHFKSKESRLPPNYDKSYYKDIGITPSDEEMDAKNPVNYVRKKLFSKSSKFRKSK